jgi:hypothetical protein
MEIVLKGKQIACHSHQNILIVCKNMKLKWNLFQGTE